MPSSAKSGTSTAPIGQNFAPTHWSLVLAAGRNDSVVARPALEKLCQSYWYPLYAFVRRKGHSPHDAQDLTQEFFARLLEKNYLGEVDRQKGKFRSFLLASLNHFLSNEWDKANAQKRGGGKLFISINADTAEGRYQHEPTDHASADKIFERRWAMTLLDRTLTRLRDEMIAQGKADAFQHLKDTLTGRRESLPYAAIAQKLGTNEGAVKVAVHRLRQRYREILRSEIAETVSTNTEVEEELRNLFTVLSS